MRRHLALLPLGLLLLAVAEVAAFIAVAHAVGGGWALLMILGASLVGLTLLRREGMRGWRRLREVAESGRPPGAQVSNSLIGLLGALLLAVPGFVSAAAGLVLLAPPVRALARRGVERATVRWISPAAAGDLFGPRRVRVRRGDPVPPPTADAEPVLTPGGAIEGEVVEGEIVR